MALRDLPPVSGDPTPLEDPFAGSPIGHLELLLETLTPKDLEDVALKTRLRAFNALRQALPQVSLRKVSIEQELLWQLSLMQALRDETLNDQDIPSNNKAQVMASMNGLLEKIAKLQEDTYTSERMKKVESLLIETLMEEEDEDFKVRFIARYEEALGKLE